MLNKILKWTIYAGVVGLLIFGAVIRTEAKSGQENSHPEMRLESGSSNTQSQGGGAGRSSEGGEGTGRNGSSSASREQRLLAEEEEHEWTSVSGIVTGLDSESLWIETNEGETLEVTGRAWSFILDAGLVFSIDDELVLDGFYENDDFEVSVIQNLTTDDSLQVREDSGRPLWSGGANH